MQFSLIFQHLRLKKNNFLSNSHENDIPEINGNYIFAVISINEINKSMLLYCHYCIVNKWYVSYVNSHVLFSVCWKLCLANVGG